MTAQATYNRQDPYETKVELSGTFWITADKQWEFDSELRQLIDKYAI